MRRTILVLVDPFVTVKRCKMFLVFMVCFAINRWLNMVKDLVLPNESDKLQLDKLKHDKLFDDKLQHDKLFALTWP